MLVLFRQTPRSILTAFLVSRVRGAKPVFISGERQFYFDETTDADTVDYDSLYSEFREMFGGLDFLEDEKLYEIVEDEMFWASRYSSRDRYLLIFTVLSQIEKRGTRAYLAQETPEAKEMKDRVRRVTGEFRRAKGHIRFEKDQKQKVLLSRASFEHDIVDLVLRHHARRRAGYSVAILDKEHAHICHNDEILVEERVKFPDKITRKDSRRYWSMLADPKHLESKRDPRYSAEPLPKNYWKWVLEGSEEIAVSQAATLDDFAK